MDKLRGLVKRGLRALGYQVRGTRYCPRQLQEPALLRRLEFDDVVCRRLFEFGPELTFIQVGAFDGITKDPLRKYIDKCGWRGVVIEPQPSAANQLRELYRNNNRIIILQAALDGKSGRRTLYTVDAPRAPAWAGGLASFRRETIVKHSDLIPGLETMILESAVDCVTFDEVLEVVKRKQIDLLQIDTEGADGYILSLFPLNRVQPAIVHWEVKHLNTSEREACLDRLAAFAYRFAPSGDEDMLAVLNDQPAKVGSPS
ncbi:MAG: FkbM family methyltransferase [Candidatus Sulfotelmatobacter sp.]